MKHDPLCGWHTKTDCFEPADDCWECSVIARARRDESQNLYRTLAKAVVDERQGWFGVGKQGMYDRGRNDVLNGLMKYLEMKSVEREIR